MRTLNLIFFFSLFFVLTMNNLLESKSSDEIDLERTDLACITLLELAAEKNKNAGEMNKYEKLKKLEKKLNEKYDDDYFSKEDKQTQLSNHNLNIKEKGKRYINKGLQKCGLK